MLQRLSAAALVCAALSPTPLAQEAAAPGFELAGFTPVPGAGGAYATLDDGRVFLFDGQHFELYDAAGGLLLVLGSLPGFVFPSFALLDPTQSFALAGESSSGDLFTVDLAGGGVRFVANLAFNYDAAFDPLDAGSVFVSAARTAFGTNDLFRLELASGAFRQVALVDGPSGPIALDAVGDLYYATQDIDFPADPGSTDVLRWTRAQIDGGALLDESDALLFAAGLDGGSALEVAPRSRHLLLAENAGSGASRVVDLGAIGAIGAQRDVVLSGTRFLSNLELFDVAAGAATFQAFQPAGVTLKVLATDFSTFASEIAGVAPARPTTTLAGPTSGPAAKTLTVEDAHPSASVVLLFGAARDFHAGELVLDLGLGFPFHSAFAVSRLRRMPFLLPTDASGTAEFRYFDPGHLHGQLGFQFAVLDAAGRVRGTSTAVLN